MTSVPVRNMKILDGFGSQRARDRWAMKKEIGVDLPPLDSLPDDFEIKLLETTRRTAQEIRDAET